jgi:gamma-glutamylcyclotransferase (GGCT)/AIG2-like uncharacterized protein YtfP
MQHVFVYGTLRGGEINDIGRAAAQHGIAAPVFVGTVAVAGELYDFGTYPGMVARAGDGQVWGDLYEIDDRLVPVLDEIERVYPGVDTLFKPQQIAVEFGGQCHACLYYPVSPNAVDGLPRIECGDWVRYRRERDRLSA